MPRNGNGVFSAPPSSWNPAINGNAATAPDWNALLLDLAAGLTQSVSRDGQSPMQANLSLGGNRIINLGQPVDDNDALRKAQIIKGDDLESAETLGIPMEGALFDVTGTATIEQLSDVFPGRIVFLKFDAGITLTHSASLTLPREENIVTLAGEYGIFVNSSAGVWDCIYYNRPFVWSVWHSKPIGEPFPLWDNLTGVDAPPTDNPDYRYIKLTAADAYNDGVLVDEEITGSAPLVVATAVISLEDSPMDGVEVNLINTEKRYLRGGTAGVVQNDALQNITGTLRLKNGATGPTSGAFDAEGNAGNLSTPQYDAGNLPSIQVSFDASRVARTDTETRPKTLEVTYYMRVK